MAEGCEREHKLATWPSWCSVIGFPIKHPRSTFIDSMLPSGSLFNGDHPMRLPLILPANLTAEQRPLYEDMRRVIETNFKGFKAIAVNGELVGPWNPWLHFPKFGGPVWELVKALSTSPSLPKSVREVAILVTHAGRHASVGMVPDVHAEGEVRLGFHGQAQLDSPWPGLYTLCFCVAWVAAQNGSNLACPLSSVTRCR
jgi:hypothetical protein